MASCSWGKAHANESTRQWEARKTKSNQRNAVLAHLQAARAAKGVVASRTIQMPTGFKVDEFNNVVEPSGEESDESKSDSFSDSGYKSTPKPTKLSRKPAASVEQAQAKKEGYGQFQEAAAYCRHCCRHQESFVAPQTSPEASGCQTYSSPGSVGRHQRARVAEKEAEADSA